ncbi:glycosyl transferase [Baffinella frigidus]|nr:glycosyl transferase [Cryptophyta sp. CCMP2293]
MAGRAHIRDEIFRFPDDVRAEARDFLNLVRAETGGTRKIVGIHVRRDWDTLRQEGMEIEWSRNVEYFSRAIEVTRKLFGPIAIVICTDDYAWASMAFKSLPQEEFPDPELTRKCKWTMACNAPLVDMAILASSDAVVVSGVSTFSWWAAYLVQEEGVVVAPRQPINPQVTNKKNKKKKKNLVQKEGVVVAPRQPTNPQG